MPQVCPRQQQAQRKKRPPWSSRTDDGVATFGLRPHQFSSSLDSLYEHMTWSVSCTSVRRSVCLARSLSVVRGRVIDVQSARFLSPVSGLTVFLSCKSTKVRLHCPECICRQSQVTTSQSQLQERACPSANAKRGSMCRLTILRQSWVASCLFQREHATATSMCWVAFFEKRTARTSMSKGSKPAKGKDRKSPKRQSLNRLCRIRAESAPETSQKSVRPSGSLAEIPPTFPPARPPLSDGPTTIKGWISRPVVRDHALSAVDHALLAVDHALSAVNHGLSAVNHSVGGKSRSIVGGSRRVDPPPKPTARITSAGLYN